MEFPQFKQQKHIIKMWKKVARLAIKIPHGLHDIVSGGAVVHELLLGDHPIPVHVHLGEHIVHKLHLLGRGSFTAHQVID